MLRKRLCTVLTFNEGILFRTKNFLPDYRYTANLVDTWSIDELILIDVTKRKEKATKDFFFKAVSNIAKNCFVPIAVGGGIRTLDDAKECFDLGAEKIIINTGYLENPNLISQIAEIYGRQAVIFAIDIRSDQDGYKRPSIHNGSVIIQKNLCDLAMDAEKAGAGEILVSTVELDGSLEGYNLDSFINIRKKVRIPCVLNSGAGNWNHFYEGFAVAGADAVCTSNIYHFTESSIASAKNYLINKNINVRM